MRKIGTATILCAILVVSSGLREDAWGEIVVPKDLTDTKMPKSKESVKRHFDLHVVSEKYFKLPHVHSKAFHDQLRTCLRDKELPVTEFAIQKLKRCGCGECREIMVDLRIHADRTLRYRADEFTETLRQTSRTIQFMLLEMDLRGRWRIERSEDGWGNWFEERSLEGRVKFLRATYWDSFESGLADNDVIKWVIKKLAPIRSPKADEALKAVLEEEKKRYKEEKAPYWGLKEELIGRARRLNGLIMKHEKLADALGKALCEDDSDLVRWAAREAAKLDVKAAEPILRAALKHHRAAYEKKRDLSRKYARDAVIEALYEFDLKVK